MKQANNYYFAGVFAAILCIAIFAGNSIFQIAFAGDNLGSLPRELRLGVELGLISQTQCKNSTLNRQITKSQFAEKLATVLDMLGSADSETKQLIKSGLITAKGMSSGISRQDTLEILARSSIFLAEAKLLTLPDAVAKNYRDYQIAEKYGRAIAYLQSKYVVRGFPDGSLGSRKRLSLRDAIFFLYRFYEAVSADLMSNRAVEGISFVDVPLSHPIMAAIKNLTIAGAFDKVMLRPSFDGDSFITVADLSEIINGLFARAGQEVDQIRLRTIFAEKTPTAFASRRHLALILEYILDSLAKDKLQANKIAYVDVTIEQPEYESLVKLAGCGLTLGYGDGRFAGKDSLTWYESVNLLNEVLKFAAIVAPVEVKTDRLAEKADIENFKALLRAKKDKIRQILNAGKKS